MYLSNPGIGNDRFLRIDKDLKSRLAQIKAESYKLETRFPTNAICGGYLYKLEIYDQQAEIEKLLQDVGLKADDELEKDFEQATWPPEKDPIVEIF